MSGDLIDVGLTAVGTWFGTEVVDNLDRLEAFGVEETFVRDKTGFVSLTRAASDVTTTEMAVEAVRDLVGRTSLDLASVDVLVVVTQNPDSGGIPHVSARVHQELGLESGCAVFDVGLGCSGYVHGLAIIRSFMVMRGSSVGLLVTADPYSRILDPSDRSTELLFGDAATASLITTDPVWGIGPVDFGTESNRSLALTVHDSGRLHMDGRAVFDFAAKRIPASIARVLDEASLVASDVDVAFLHQGSKFIADTIRKRLDADWEVPFHAGRYGNTVSSSIPIMLAEIDTSNYRRILLSGFGVGLAWATTILERQRDD